MVLNSTIRQVIFWVVFIGGAILLVQVYRGSTANGPQEYAYSKLVQDVNEGKVKKAVIEGSTVKGELQSGTPFTAEIGNEFVARDVAEIMRQKNVDVKFKPPAGSGLWVQIFTYFFPVLLIIGFWIFMIRQMQSGGNKALSFGKSRAKLLSNQQKRVTFKDVAGVDEAKEELQEIIEFLKEPQKFQKLGGKIPKGVLMVGPPRHRKDTFSKSRCR